MNDNIEIEVNGTRYIAECRGTGIAVYARAWNGRPCHCGFIRVKTRDTYDADFVRKLVERFDQTR